MAFDLGLPGGIALALICIPATIDTPDPVVGTLAGVGIAIAIAPGWFLSRGAWFMRDAWERYKAAGDHEVRPYLTAGSFALSRQQDFLRKP